MTVALPAGPAPAPRRQLLVGTTLAGVAVVMLIGGMSTLWLRVRDGVVSAGERFPVDYIIPEVATNVMLMTIGALCLFAQWAVYSARRGDRAHTGLALGVVLVMGIAFINAQAFVITGTMTAVVIGGLALTVVAAFRSLGGRDREFEIVSAHALLWYFIAAAYAVVWFVVYVTK